MTHPERHRHSKVFRGTLDEVLAHRGEIPAGATVELKVLEERPKEVEKPRKGTIAEPTKPKVLKALGMMAGITNTEDFMRRKHEEMLWEDMPMSERSRL